MNPPRAQPLLALVGAAGLAAVAAALVSQHRFDMQPCAWCVLQRAIFVAIAVVALSGAWMRARRAHIAVASAIVALCLAGVASALWQHFVAAASHSCRLTLAERIVSGLRLDAIAPEVFAPRASCADAAVRLLGVPYEFWSLAMYLLLAAVAVGAARARPAT